MQTGCPIIYTSADSVVQIARRNQLWPARRFVRSVNVRGSLDQLELNVGRVIARPFVGTSPTDFPVR